MPFGWRVAGEDEALYDPNAPGMRGALFHAKLPPEFEGPFWSPSAYQIPPGDSLAGFILESPYPPGYARTYVQGYSGSLFPPDPLEDSDAYYATNPTPHDTTDSQRGWTLGPTRYTTVVTGGNRRPGTDGFLGFMNLAEKGSVLTSPAPIALKFSLNGETVFSETLRVELNGVNVTGSFFPGPPDGADLVGVFRIDSSALLSGKNVLLTSVDGMIAGTNRTGTDSDRITFHVDPSLATSTLATYGLENLPLAEPGFE